MFVYNELMKKQFPGEVVFLCTKRISDSFKRAVSEPVYVIEAGRIIDEVKAAYHVMTAKTVIVDNYYGFLAVADFRKNVECIQIWHATGAVKNFGLLDTSVESRPERAKYRFIQVYRKFHKIVVGSDAFAEIFKKAFRAKDGQFLKTGYPRTDVFFSRDFIKERKEKFFKKYPMYKGKKIILYAPTYRPEPEQNRFVLDIEKMYEQLGGDYALFIRMHPAVNLPDLDHYTYKGFATDFSTGASIQDLMLVSDYLITDYSSIPFEYVLLKKPMIFYPYDLEEYKKNPGIWDRYDRIVPAPVAYTTDEIIKFIRADEFNQEKYREFDRKWNQYNDGRSAESLADYILERHGIKSTTEEG